MDLLKFRVVFVLLFVLTFNLNAQKITWSKADDSFFVMEENEIVNYKLPNRTKTIVFSKENLKSLGASEPLKIQSFSFSLDYKKILLFTNTKKVWRLNTKGDYWVYDIVNRKMQQVGKSKPISSLMFAKFSPDAKQVAYVSENNIYVEDLLTNNIKALTNDGTRKLINGTFDWAYEEEFFCRDGFRWSPDSKKIAFWQIDARTTHDYLMINNTDDIYPVVVPVEYPVAGVAPSPFKIGVVEINSSVIKWMAIPTDSVLQSYLPRMEWAANSNELVVQHLNRKQNQSDIRICDALSGSSTIIYTEKDKAWIDVLGLVDTDYANGGWDWINNGNDFVWVSEKNGWRQLYLISKDGKKETLITRGNYDVIDIVRIDEKNNFVYYLASPKNATQKYLYRTPLNGNGNAELISPVNQQGTHNYNVSTNGNYAEHSFSNYYTENTKEWISLPTHIALNNDKTLINTIAKANKMKSPVEFFKIKTTEGIEMDGWMVKPVNFDTTKKYPVVFYVYTEPWGQNVTDEFNVANNFLYKGNMAADGYIYISIDNRGTPVPKGREWRKSIYRKIGKINISDQAMAAKEILKWPFVDKNRIAVWGWSGGGSATLGLMFQFPEIYKTGIAIAAVGNQLTYDNIYQERYMGLPQENLEDFVNGSPITYAKNLKGNLLYIHGTGDDNVHFNNAEMLVNELIKHNKQFQLMTYPGRTHSISEGEGTFEHLSTMYTNYLKQYCAPGGISKK
jgi:dipeptidyl-peptidase 4